MPVRVRTLLVMLVSAAVSASAALTGAVVAPAAATSTRLCTTYSGCIAAGYSDAGYGKASGSMYWRMYSGHNCTNYVAYRMVQSGLPNVRPWSGSGNGSNWGVALSDLTDQTPRVGAVAWWKANVPGAGSSGHVAYVEEVISADEIIVSQDSWGGTFSWARITRSGTGWPSGFIHLNDVELENTALPAIRGELKVGATVTATPGAWSVPDVTLGYRWRADGVRIPTANSPSLTLTPDLEGAVLTLRVVATKPGFQRQIVLTDASGPVQPGALTPVEEPAVTGEAVVDSTVTADPGTWNPVPEQVTYRWFADGRRLRKATAPTLDVTPTLAGKELTVAVTARKSGYDAVTASSAPTAPVERGTLIAGSSPTVSGEPRLGETLSVKVPTASPDAVAVVRWFRGGERVRGAGEPTYVVTADDLGARIVAQVTFRRTGYTPLPVRSVPTARVKSEPRFELTTEVRRGVLHVGAAVSAPEVASVTGVLRVLRKGSTIAEFPVRDGLAQGTVKGLPQGRTRLRFRFTASEVVAASVIVRAVRVPRG